MSEGISQIMDNLWIGSVPPAGDYSQFNLIVLAAEEYPLEAVAGLEAKGGHVRVLEVRLPDSQLDDEQRNRALTAAAEVARYLQAGKNVLSTCAMGINRGSLIAALALVMLGGKPNKVIELIREKRSPSALCNPYFVELIYETYVEILEKEIDGLIDAMNKMLGTRTEASRSHAS